VNWIDVHVYDENSADPSALWRGHHLSFRVSDYDGAIKILKVGAGCGSATSVNHPNIFPIKSVFLL
jgi:hypothetical protein